MNLLYFDSVGGASGDMILAALLDLGVDRAWVEDELAKLGLGPFRLHIEATTDRGIRGLRLSMDLPVEHGHEQPHTHSHRGLAGLLHKVTGHSHGHSHEAAGPATGHRGLTDIEAILNRAGLPGPVLENSLKVFRRIAQAEARVHATTPDKIHFHEVGALDSIADIVGCNLCLHRLAVDRVAVAPLPIGRGTVRCAHGVLPLPAPATVELLAGFPVYPVDETVETVTPTGAALLSTWKNQDSPPAAGCWEKVGHGLGTHALRDRPNLLRAFLYSETTQSGGTDDCLVLECNLDDLTPELIGALTPCLLEKGALDVFTTPVFMKKQRPGVLLTVLCKPEAREAMIDLLFRESTTFGVREHRVSRTVLERRFETVQTPYGPVRLKIGTWQGKTVTASPEYGDCLACAEKAGVPVKTVYQCALASSTSLIE
jgi:uncharacterized protein (TIGR00299 family) protein